MTPNEVVQRAAEALLAEPPVEDGDAVVAMVAAGVSADDADRAVAMLPVACGRVWLEPSGVRLPDGCVYAGERDPRPLAEDPMYAPALGLALRLRASDWPAFAALAARDAAKKVVVDLVSRGSRPEDLDISPPVFTMLERPAVIARAPLPSAPPPPSVACAMRLAPWVEAHGLQACVLGRVVHHVPARLALEPYVSRVNDTGDSVQLDVHVESPLVGDRELCESQVGFGADPTTAALDALEAFRIGSLHVLLASIVRPDAGGNQVEWEDWRDGSQSWRACIGGVVLRRGKPAALDLAPWVDDVRAAFLASRPLRGLHWMRLFTMRDASGAALVDEALADGNAWPLGLRTLDRRWPAFDRPYSVRRFIAVSP